MSMTTNKPSVVDEDAFIVRRTIDISAPPSSVWQAITDPAHISQWFGTTVLDGTGPGSIGTMDFPGYATIPLRVDAVDEPHSISYRWNNDDALGSAPDRLEDASSTVFTFTLEPTAVGTRLTVVESGFENTSNPTVNLAEHAKGWVSELDKLVALLEGAA